MSRISLDDHARLISARWKHPNKYGKKIVVTDHGYGYYSIGFDKTTEQLLSELNEYESKSKKNTDKLWWQIWK